MIVVASVLLACTAAQAVHDTGRSSAEPMAPGSVFAGDAVMSNGRVKAVARKGGPGVEIYSAAPVLRATLQAPGGLIDRISLVENGRSSATLEVAWTSPALVAQFRLKKGDLFIESRAVSGEAPLRVAAPGRFAVLPDFFADDILVDARKIPMDRVELPSENFILHFTGERDAIVMGVFENRDQEVRVTLEGRGEARAISGSEIEFGKGRKIWVAVLEAPGIWHSVDVGPEHAKKILPLEWKMPFVAQWRVDFTRKDELTDSWDMLLQNGEGQEYIKPSWLGLEGRISESSRTATGEVDRDAYKPGGPASERLGANRERWTTVLGKVQYPCWSDHERKGHLQPLEHKRLAHVGAVVIYPINRLAETPIESFTPMDVMRNTLGVGPCQYILDVEGQKQEHVGRATCHVRTLLNEIYGSGEQKGKRKEIEAYLGDAFDFVVHIRNRILAYVAFGKELRKVLDEARRVHPELKDFLDEMEALVREIDERVEPRWEKIRQQKVIGEISARLVARKEEATTPACVAELNRDFLKSLIAYEGADWKARFKKEYTDPLTAIGGNQDDMVGECRWVVKALRQKAGLRMAADPKVAPVAAELRARAQKILRGGAAYEGARH